MMALQALVLHFGWVCVCEMTMRPMWMPHDGTAGTCAAFLQREP